MKNPCKLLSADNSRFVELRTGFMEWTSGTAPYYAISSVSPTLDITINSGTGLVDSNWATWVSTSLSVPAGQFENKLIYIVAVPTATPPVASLTAVAASETLFLTSIPLFSIWTSPDGRCIVCRLTYGLETPAFEIIQRRKIDGPSYRDVSTGGVPLIDSSQQFLKKSTSDPLNAIVTAKDGSYHYGGDRGFSFTANTVLSMNYLWYDPTSEMWRAETNTSAPNLSTMMVPNAGDPTPHVLHSYHFDISAYLVYCIVMCAGDGSNSQPRVFAIPQPTIFTVLALAREHPFRDSATRVVPSGPLLNIGFAIVGWAIMQKTPENVETLVEIIDQSEIKLNGEKMLLASIADNKLAPISSAGKVLNSATSASIGLNPGTESLVLRDTSGNCSINSLETGNVHSINLEQSLLLNRIEIKNLQESILTNITVGTNQDLELAQKGAIYLSADTDANGPAEGVVLKHRNTPLANFAYDGSQIYRSILFSGTTTHSAPVIMNSDLSLPLFSTPGLLKNAADGKISSSLLVNADIAANATISDSKLATISSAGKVLNSATSASIGLNPGVESLVLRDVSGNCSINSLETGNVHSINLEQPVSLNRISIKNLQEDVLTFITVFPTQDLEFAQKGAIYLSADIDANGPAEGIVIKHRETVLADFAFDGSVIHRTILFDGAATHTAPLVASSDVYFPAFSSPGLLHTGGTNGLISSSLLTNADIAADAAIAASKLGNIPNSKTTATAANTANMIMSRGSTGEFAAGAATLTGLTVSGLTTVGGVVQNSSEGVLSSALITDANIAANAAISNSKTSATAANTANAIVARDASGGFAAGAATLTGLTVTGLTTPGGVLQNTINGLISSALIGDAQIAENATISASKIGDIPNSKTTASSTPGENLIVTRDDSGNFSTGGITATALTVSGLTTANGVLQNTTGGVISSALIGNDQIAADAAIAASKLGNIPNSKTTASAVPGNGSIVARDDSGNFSTGGITSTGLTVSGLTTVGGVVQNTAEGVLSSALITDANIAADAAISASKIGDIPNSKTTASSTPGGNLIVTRDDSGNFSTGGITAEAVSATTLTVTGLTTEHGVVQNTVGGVLSSALITDANIAANAAISNSKTSATAANTADSIIARDTSGGFAAGAASLTALTVSGLITPNGVLQNTTGGAISSALIGDAQIAADAAIAASKLGNIPNSKTTASSTPGESTIVARDGSGNFSTGGITASSLTVGNLSTVGGVVQNTAGGVLSSALITDANIAANAAISNSKTSATAVNTASAIISRGEAGEFAAGAATLTGLTVSGLTTSNGVLQNTTEGVISSALISNAQIAADAAIAASKLGNIPNSKTTATAANTADAIVTRGPDGEFAAGAATITALTVSELSTTNGVLQNTAGGIISSALITDANIAADAAISNSKTSATAANTASAIMARGSTGEFAAGAATLTGLTVSGLTTPNGVLQNTTGGVISSALISNAQIAADAAIAASKIGNIPNSQTTASSVAGESTIVARDGLGNFSTGGITATTLSVTDLTTVHGVVQNTAGGVLSSALITDANIAANAAISNSKTSATAANTFSAIVARDASGGFAAGAVTATGLTVSGLTTPNGVLQNTTGGVISSALISDAQIAADAAIAVSKIGDIPNSKTTASSTAGNGSIVARDNSGNFSTGGITASSLTVGNLSTVGGVVQNTAGGVLSSALITDANIAANAAISNSKTSATAANTASAIISRGTAGEFAAGAATLTALTVSGLTTSNGVLQNTAEGAISSALISNAQIAADAAIAASKLGNIPNSKTTATAANTADAIITRGSTGEFSAGDATVTALTVSGLTTPNGVLQNTTGGVVSSAQIGNAQIAADAAIAASKLGNIPNSKTTATAANTASAIVARDASGDFAAGTATLSALTVSGLTTANGVIQNSAEGVLSSALIRDAQIAADAAIAASKLGNIPNSKTTASSAPGNDLIVTRDSSGNFSTGGITASSLAVGNLTTVSGVLQNAVDGTISSAQITDANIAANAAISNSKTSATAVNTANAIVARDASGNFTASQIGCSEIIGVGPGGPAPISLNGDIDVGDHEMRFASSRYGINANPIALSKIILYDLRDGVDSSNFGFCGFGMGADSLLNVVPNGTFQFAFNFGIDTSTLIRDEGIYTRGLSPRSWRGEKELFLNGNVVMGDNELKFNPGSFGVGDDTVSQSKIILRDERVLDETGNGTFVDSFAFYGLGMYPNSLLFCVPRPDEICQFIFKFGNSQSMVVLRPSQVFAAAYGPVITDPYGPTTILNQVNFPGYDTQTGYMVRGSDGLLTVKPFSPITGTASQDLEVKATDASLILNGGTGMQSGTPEAGLHLKANGTTQMSIFADRIVMSMVALNAAYAGGPIAPGEVDIPMYISSIQGVVKAQSPSSIRYKENVIAMEDTSYLHSLRPVNFSYISDSNHLKQYGLIAEEVYRVCPELVYKRAGEIEGVLYDKLPVMLLAEIQKLKKENTELKEAAIAASLTDVEALERLTRNGQVFHFEDAVTGDLKVAHMRMNGTKHIRTL